MQLYRASDRLLKHKSSIEKKIFEQVQSIFNFTPTITLYDLTNTYFEGHAEGNPKAKRGRSKEKRSDCPLVTLGLMLDGSGFIRHSEVFSGSVNEGKTLPEMLKSLAAPQGALVIMDAGIASEENLKWLNEEGYKYLVVSRERKRSIDMDQASCIQSACGHEIYLHRQSGKLEGEVKIACWSEQRARKEREINTHFCEKFEKELRKLNEGLGKPRCMKKCDKIHERIGRLKERCKGVAQHYRIELEVNKGKDIVTKIEWHFEPVKKSKQTNPGVYNLRTNEADWDDEMLWRTYTMLTDLEAVFRSLKSDLGMRPVYHHKEDRCDGHLFITVLAYQAVQVVRRKLKEQGVNESWRNLRDIFEVQRRVTTTFKQKDGRTLHVRKATQPEMELKDLYKKLGMKMNPGGTKRMVI
jgi:transposase